MLVRPAKGRGLFYTRDSGGEHETTPREYVLWAQRRAIELGVTFSGKPDTIEAMIREGRFHDGDLFLDYGVKGNELDRLGLNSLFEVGFSDVNATHVFIPRRDRLARPDNPLDGIRLEERLRRGGLTIVFMDKLLPPIRRGGRSDVAEMIMGFVDYDKAERDRRELAEKILYAQMMLAKAGYSTGGRPPYAFRRWLVNASGEKIRQLAEGEYVKRSGHHVILLPGPDEEVRIVLRILTMLETVPASQVANLLTAEGVPSPDAGRYRTDSGIRHQVSGTWNQATIIAIARNPLLLALTQYGRRSMGDRCRFTANGPRELEESDHREDEKPKVVINPEAARLTASAHFEPIVDVERHKALLVKLDKRAGTQRGKPRSHHPEKNPLGCRVFDMACGWPMYRQPYGESFRYLCGRYLENTDACEHNHVDGLLATRFMLNCIKQRVLAPTVREKLEARVRAIAEKVMGHTHADADLAAKRVRANELTQKKETVGKNLALASSPEQFQAISAVFNDLSSQERLLRAELAQLESPTVGNRSLDAEVSSAMSGLDRLAEVMSQADTLAEAGKLFTLINARLFLRFTKIKQKKRFVNRPASGFVTFGSVPPPVALYEAPTGRRKGKPCDSSSKMTDYLGGEGKSLRNVNRGDRI